MGVSITDKTNSSSEEAAKLGLSTWLAHLHVSCKPLSTSVPHSETFLVIAEVKNGWSCASNFA